ncbi:MAG: hypothetical protein Q4F60_03555, partial [Candidatus Saccharibacteria bacterium]|nr:hypothetical protein [Candidatus Saccharibacteria bacterium]
KLIATLGVVAGLGVAALPLGSVFATQQGQTVAGNVQLDVEVQPAIAMTITGNNDDDSNYKTGVTATAVSVAEGDSLTGLYTRSGEAGNYSYTAASGTALEAGTYYKLGVDVKAPSDATTIDGHSTAIAYDSLNLQSSSSYLSILPNQAKEGSVENGFRSTITVYTNNTSGYNLNVRDADTTTDLTQVVTSGTADIIPTGSGAIAAGTAKWNFDTTVAAGGTTEALTAAAMPASNATATPIDTFGSQTNNGRVTVVDYNVSTKSDQAAGVYTNTITYTATTN